MKDKKTTRGVARFFKDDDGNIVLWQTPNPPLIGWAVFKVLAMFIHTSTIKSGFEHLGMALLFTWAYMEIKSGASYFRRLLGVLVMLALLMGYFKRA